jgi:hypothetical protein
MKNPTALQHLIAIGALPPSGVIFIEDGTFGPDSSLGSNTPESVTKPSRGVDLGGKTEAAPARAATEFLDAAARHQHARAAEYDSPQGERSMASTVAAFNAVTGNQMTEAEGWQFMAILKAVRLFSAPGFHRDSAEDQVSYAALTAEAMAAEGC